MKKKYLIIILIIFFIFENILLVFLTNWYYQNKSFQIKIEANAGLTNTCKDLQISDSLTSVLEKMNKFYPIIVKNQNGSIALDYGLEWLEAPGTSLVFNEKYLLTNKSCNGKWEPEIESFRR